jgi:hypothetical protein
MGIIHSSDNNFSNIDFSDVNPEHVIPDDFKKRVLKEFILPYYKTNIEYVINEKTIWSRVGTVFLTTSTILIGTASILSFASSTYQNANLNFIAGSVGMIALVLKEFASYANSVDHIKTLTINDLLKNLGIKHSLNDSSKNFKKVIQDDKTGNLTPTPTQEVDNNKLELLLTNINSRLSSLSHHSDINRNSNVEHQGDNHNNNNDENNDNVNVV